MDANQKNLDSAKAANEMTEKQAQINRDFQERMSNTAHRREMADLQAAGMNPLLTMTGSGASTPAGGSGSFQAAHVENALSGMGTAAKDAIGLKQAIESTKANINLTNKQAATADAARRKTEAETKIIRAQTPEQEAKGGIWQAVINGAKDFIKGSTEMKNGTATGGVLDLRTKHLLKGPK